jgi:hypothetical protein
VKVSSPEDDIKYVNLCGETSCKKKSTRKAKKEISAKTHYVHVFSVYITVEILPDILHMRAMSKPSGD